jgi:aminomethyltransferase
VLFRSSWITKLDTGFIGSESLAHASIEKQLVPLVLKERAIPRADYKIFDDNNKEIGLITSGAMSPSLQFGIALAYIDLPYAKELNSFNVKIRNNTFSMDKAKLPFYKDGTYLK